jgi:hypothetical protein
MNKRAAYKSDLMGGEDLLHFHEDCGDERASTSLPLSPSEPDYLSFNWCSIPESMYELLPTRDELRLWSFVMGLSRKMSKEGFYTNIHSKAKSNFGPYSKSLSRAERAGYIKTNHKYEWGNIVEDRYFPKSHLLTDKSLNEPWRSVCIKEQWKPYKDRSTATGFGVEHEKQCFQEIKLSKNKILPLDTQEKNLVIRALRKIDSGAGNFKFYKNSGRLGNTLIESPRSTYKNLEHKNGKFVKVDIVACHHFLAGGLIDGDEKRRYYEEYYNKGDIYDMVPASMGVHYNSETVKLRNISNAKSKKPTKHQTPRDLCKEDSLRFINGGGHGSGRYWVEYHSERHPSLTKYILKYGKKNALTLQKIESSLVSEWRDFAAKNNLFFISEHDGCLTLEHQAMTLIHEFQRICRVKYGYAPAMTYVSVTGLESKVKVDTNGITLKNVVYKSISYSCSNSHNVQSLLEDKDRQYVLNNSQPVFVRPPDIPPEYKPDYYSLEAIKARYEQRMRDELRTDSNSHSEDTLCEQVITHQAGHL